MASDYDSTVIKAGVINTPSCTVTGRFLHSSTSRINPNHFCRLKPNHPSNHPNSRQTTRVVDQIHGNPLNALLDLKPKHPGVSPWNTQTVSHIECLGELEKWKTLLTGTGVGTAGAIAAGAEAKFVVTARDKYGHAISEGGRV